MLFAVTANTVVQWLALLPLAIEGCKGKLGTLIWRNEREWLFVSIRPIKW